MTTILFALLGGALLVLTIGGLIPREPRPMDNENPFDEMDDK
jgi:hypothetical protein